MFRVGIGSFAAETHTFLRELTTVDRFEENGVLWGQDIIDNNHSMMRDYVDGYVEVLREANAEIVGAMQAVGGVYGWVTEEAFDRYTAALVDRLRSVGPLDGVLLGLHGAMAVTGVSRPEAEIVRRVRSVVGDIPIMGTLDFHANEDQELIDVTDAVFVGRNYPHTDMKRTGKAAARCLVATLRGEFRPCMAIEKPGIITPSVFQWTDSPPASDFLALADEWQRRESNIYYISIAHGFGYADVPDAGASVIVVTNGDPHLARMVAKDISDHMWERREELARKKVASAPEAVRTALELISRGVRPVVLADGSDRTGDSTHVLRELLTQKAHNVVLSSMNDAGAVRECERAGTGAVVRLRLGGWGQASGEPLEVTGRVQWVGSGDYTLTGPMGRGSRALCGPSAVIDIGDGNRIVITSHNHQAIDEQGIAAFGLDFDAFDIMILRSRVHFHACYDRVAGAVLEVDAPGMGPADLTTLDYKNIPADLFPVGRKWRQ